MQQPQNTGRFLSKAVLEMIRTHLSLVSTMDEMEGMIAKLPLQEQEVQKRCRQLEERRNELARYQKIEDFRIRRL